MPKKISDNVPYNRKQLSRFGIFKTDLKFCSLISQANGEGDTKYKTNVQEVGKVYIITRGYHKEMGRRLQSTKIYVHEVENVYINISKM